jgi:hypothetical protein
VNGFHFTSVICIRSCIVSEIIINSLKFHKQNVPTTLKKNYFINYDIIIDQTQYHWIYKYFLNLLINNDKFFKTGTLQNTYSC